MYRFWFISLNECTTLTGFLSGSAVQYMPAVQELKEMGVQSLGQGSPRGGQSKALQYSCLKNPMDRGAWWATVHRIAKRQTRLKLFNMRTHTKSQWGGDSVPVSFHSSPIIKKQKIGIHDTCVSLGTVWVVKNRRNRRLLIQPLSVT